MKKYLFFCCVFLLGWFSISFSQEMTSREIDSISQKLYQFEEWQELTKLIRSARKQGIDYYWLRMREGDAWFQLKKYSRAIDSYSAARKMNRTESAAKGLYYSWLYAGDRASARLFAPEMDSLSRSVSFDVKSTKLLQSLTLECGTKLSSHQTLASNQSYVGLTVRSFLGKRFTWQQSYGYTEQNLYFGLATQHSYFTQVNLTAQPGMEIGIGTHLLSTFQENVYLNTQTTQNSYLSAIVIKKRLSDVEVGSLGAIGKITGVTHWQLASWLTVFPLGSPVWFLTGNVNYHAPTFLVRKPLALKFGTGGIIGKRISIFSEFCHSHEVVTVNGAMAFPLNNGIPNDYRISALFSWYINKRFSLAAIWLYEQKQLRYLTWEWDRNEFFFMNSFYLLLSLRPF